MQGLNFVSLGRKSAQTFYNNLAAKARLDVSAGEGLARATYPWIVHAPAGISTYLVLKHQSKPGVTISHVEPQKLRAVPIFLVSSLKRHSPKLNVIQT